MYTACQNYDPVVFQRNSWGLYAYTVAIRNIRFFVLTKIFTKIFNIAILRIVIIFNKNEASFDVKKKKARLNESFFPKATGRN